MGSNSRKGISLPQINKTATEINNQKKSKIEIDKNCPARPFLAKDQR